MAHVSGALHSFLSMKRRVILLLPPWMGHSPKQGYLRQLIRQYLFIHLGEERHCESKVSCPRTQHCARPGLKPRSLEPDSGALTIRPLLLPVSNWCRSDCVHIFFSLSRCNTCPYILPQFSYIPPKIWKSLKSLMDDK